MTDLSLFGTPAGGTVGTRQLVALQTIDLGRLTHHPVPLVPSALVAVSGTGPGRDSNGSGKTTFLAAAALLLGDPEWRVATSGGGDALGLLFDPDLSGDSAGLYDPARVGYVAGVFAHVTADGHYDDLTIWVRISADDSPRLCARWAPGVHLISERDQAASMWNSLGRDRQLGPTAYVEHLYGGTGRCLAYVTSRGNRDSDTSLMQLQARLSPSRIGSELIILLGLEHLIDGERELRAKLADAQQKLAVRVEKHEHHEREWEATLVDIAARDAARAALAEGKALWQLRIARKLLDALAEHERIDGELTELGAQHAEALAVVSDVKARLNEFPDLSALGDAVAGAEEGAEQASDAFDSAKEHDLKLRIELKQLATQIDDLTGKALGAPAGLTADDAERADRAAAEAADEATKKVGAAETHVEEVQRALDRVSDHGEADDEAFTALAGAGIETAALTDGIVVAEDARARWEPLLAMWRSALVVRAPERDRAVAAAPPGTVLVVSDEASGPLPSGIERAPAGTGHFLATLLDREAPPYTDVAAGVVVTGGFANELCGREAALERARKNLSVAERALTATQEDEARAKEHHRLAADALERVRAAATLVDLRAREAELNAELATASVQLGEARGARETANRVLIDAQVALRTASEERERLVDEVERGEEQARGIQEEIAAAEATLARLDADGWRRAWNGTDAEALAAMEHDDRQEDTFRRRATEQLVNALVRLGIDPSTGDHAPTDAIAVVIRARRGLDDDVAPANEVRRFDTVAQPLVDWLDDLHEQDAAFRKEVEQERARWNELITAARRECDAQTDLLERQRDMVEQQIEAALAHVSARYEELDVAAGGYGARLQWRSARPERPTDLWVWDVTPEWRRAPGGKWLPYTRQANSAMQKQHRTHLVLAALLAAENPAGRVLIVDEAGNDFGREHLRQVLSAFAHVAETHGVTVIAACQDKVLEEVAALGAARLLLWFERLSDASPLCRPTRVWGFDPERGRVELTRDAVEAGRLL
jgi:chromosome segregation protein